MTNYEEDERKVFNRERPAVCRDGEYTWYEYSDFESLCETPGAVEDVDA